MSKRDTDNLATMATDLQAENARLKAERDEARRRETMGDQQQLHMLAHCQQLMAEVDDLRDSLARLAAENASLREAGRVAEAERDEARAEVASLHVENQSLREQGSRAVAGWHRTQAQRDALNGAITAVMNFAASRQALALATAATPANEEAKCPT